MIITNALILNHIQHIGIPVTNLIKSQEFYKKLSFDNVMEASFDQEREKGICVMMQSGTMIIELYQLPEKFLSEIKTRKNGHIDHIAFDVPDIDAAFTWIKTAGLQPLEVEPQFLQFWKNGCKYFNITGPDGERLEFNQIL
ncbi:MAG: VOC family protein [Sphingobacteriaceae bacterium]|nr:MAG: VOC family protein [Sphingobacteriaceae bacterium]